MTRSHHTLQFPVLFLALLLALPAPAPADTVLLTDGTILQGTLTRRGEQLCVFTPEGAFLPVQSQNVQKVTLNTAPTAAQVSAADWTRLQSQVKKADDLNQIIYLYQKFVAVHPDAAESALARKALDDFTQMAAGDYLKYHGLWMRRAQLELHLRLAAEKARPAADLLAAGKPREALAAAQDALKIDDQNSSALTTASLAAFRLNQLPAARDFLLRLVAAEPTSLLGWNNLAVICFAQNRQAEALQDYTSALAVAPGHRLLLDNITQALRDYTGSPDAPSYQALLRQYQQAETRYEAVAAQRGLYRYGATWLTLEQRDKALAGVQAIQAQMTQLDAQYAQAQAAYAALDAEINRANDCANGALNDYNYYTSGLIGYGGRGWDVYWANGRAAAYWDFDRWVRYRTGLEDQRRATALSINQMRAQAPLLKAALAKAEGQQWVGVQRLMEPGDETNVPPPAAAAPPPPILGVPPALIPPPAPILPWSPPTTVPAPAVLPTPATIPIPTPAPRLQGG